MTKRKGLTSPWSSENKKKYVVGQSYGYVRLTADRIDPKTKAMTHCKATYKLKKPFVYQEDQNYKGFTIYDGITLDAAFCELVNI